ncbi:hypothetical protein NZNM25_08650 [Nitrosopumilus zosterae]|uniref:4Fe-4S ferredoxin-type domain-containing protein n=1 Tax=Nitrosopumilus zosterae TaxID=718286 RepID=A0A2S2KR30_9ARCH|nr:ferredoxin family protein [Nitrosopumilus zosterae]BDQ30492.1 ferredoxin family protein [Nitrosopumilus zosterae]GBH34074.1 hypothetical protein NZNM25_08650 [Nitrosopumilus zosterae]
MPIDESFPEGMEPIGKIMHSDGENFHWFWGPGKLKEASTHSKTVKDFAKRGEKIEPLGVSCTMVAVYWDSCYADGACIEACPVQVFQWYRTEKDIPAKSVIGETFDGTGENSDKEGRKDYTDKSDPIREHDCIWCMICVSVCPPQAIKVDQSNHEFHEKAAGSYQKLGSGQPNPHVH